MMSSKESDPRLPPSEVDESQDRQVCVDCDQSAPATETNYTLISQRHGWRLTRGADSSGRRVMEWRCPRCFARLRDKRTPVR